MIGYAKIVYYDNWWLTFAPIDDVGDYYRYMFNHANRARLKIQKPKWGSHISILRMEEPTQNKHLWNSFLIILTPGQIKTIKTKSNKSH